MSFEFWGADALPNWALPQHPEIGYFLLAIYLIVIGWVVYRMRAGILSISRRQTLWTFLLILLALLFSQILPFSLTTPSQLPPLATTANPYTIGTPFGAVPILLATWIHPLAAILVAFASGLGRAFWQTHQIFTPFQWAITGYLMSWCWQQNYNSQLSRWLRRPYIHAPLALLFQLLFILPTTYAYADPSVSWLTTFDFTLSTTWAYVFVLSIEGLVTGLIVALLLQTGIHPIVPAKPQPAPGSRSLRFQLLASFTLFAIVLTMVLLGVVYSLAVRVSRQLIVNQMAYNASTISNRIPGFLAQRQNFLQQYSQDSLLWKSDSETQAELLRLLFRSSTLYRRVMLADRAGTILHAIPNGSITTLTHIEQTALQESIENIASITTSAQSTEEDGVTVSFIVPIISDDSLPAVLIGRLPDLVLKELIAGLQGTMGEGQGFLVDQTGQIIAHLQTEHLLTSWKPAPEPARFLSTLPPNTIAYEGREGITNARELVVYAYDETHPWTVVTTVPYDIVLELAIQIAIPLAAVLLLSAAGFGFTLIYFSTNISRRLIKLNQAAHTIAEGSLDTPIAIQGYDEIGQLGASFSQMQTALQKRLAELSLLLNISQEVSASIDIQAGMPAILQGAIRGTGASGVRIVVLNPNSSQPRIFSEGPASSAMAVLDRTLMNRVRQEGELILRQPHDIYSTLSLDPQQSLPVRSLIALPVYSGIRFQGVFWLGTRLPHQFSQSELNLLHTLVGHISILVVNGYLFSSAENGRRRLAAVLASTSDAVIVTDQTDRIVLLNPAMENAFNLRMGEVVNQPAHRVIQSSKLLEALTGIVERGHDWEIETEDGATWYASASPIVGNDGQVMGRVVVLRDITNLKEVDRLKSEFVQTVSHDLRTPLTYLKGFAEMLPIMGDLNPKQREYAEKIQAGIDQMTVLVTSLLDLSRIEAGYDLVMSDVDVGAVLQTIRQEFSVPAEAAGLSLVLEVPARLPILQGDTGLIRQAIANFVGNAIKYSPNSGKLLLRAAVTDKELVLSVKDNGPGIAKSDQERLFEKFYRVRDRKNERIKGSGLGLAIVRSIAQRHNGRVWCESEVGRGSTFYIAFPII